MRTDEIESNLSPNDYVMLENKFYKSPTNNPFTITLILINEHFAGFSL
jgi:hypothetical protein